MNGPHRRADALTRHNDRASRQLDRGRGAGRDHDGPGSNEVVGKEVHHAGRGHSPDTHGPAAVEPAGSTRAAASLAASSPPALRGSGRSRGPSPPEPLVGQDLAQSGHHALPPRGL